MVKTRHTLIAKFISVLLLLFSWPASAAELAPVRIDGDAPRFGLDGHFALYSDNDPSLTLDDVIRRDAFLAPGRENLQPGIRWYRFTVERGVGMPADWILAFGEPDIDDARLFVPRREGGFGETRLGRGIPSQDLPLAARHHLARIALPDDGPATLYLRLASAHKIRFEEAALWRPDALMFHEAKEIAQLGLRQGILLILVIGYGLFGAWGRDVPMLLYALYVATILSRALTHTGMITLYYPAGGSGLNHLLGAFGLVGGASVFVFMWDSILGLRQTRPVMHRIYLAVGSAMALALVGSLAMGELARPVVRASQMVMLAASVVSVALAILMVRRSADNALLKFYLVAFLPLIAVGIIRLVAPVLPIIPIDLGRFLDVLSNTTHIGILAVALAYRLSRMQQERVRIREELAGERRVQQRLRTFIDMTTHEFKTPLAVIDSAAQVMRKLAPTLPGIAERVEIIRLSVRRLVGLIETCLAGERYETMEIKPAQVSPVAIAAKAVERNRPQDGSEVVARPPQTPEMIWADAELLGIALDALIDNARRYGPADQPVEVTVETRPGGVTFGIHDRGPGVPAGEVGNIFEKYYRCAATASVPGTGIGLHLVMTVAELHGGSVCYAPRPGGGASFLLTIPAEPDLAAAAASRTTDRHG